MSKRVSDQVAQLDTESWRILNRTIRRLESAWRHGRPDLSEFVPDDSDPLRTSVLLQLIKVDQELSWETDERRLLESYLADWPELEANSDALTELLAAECLNRALVDAPLDAAELQRRFPDVADRIDLQVIAGQAQDDGRRPGRSVDVTKQESDGAAHPEPTPGIDFSAGLLPSNHFGRYEIRERIGHGSMGAVYRAWDTRLRREVALKIPHFGKSADATLTDQFQQEAVAMAQVHHPAVCPVFDAFEVDGTFALTMACVDGQNLGDCLAQHRIDQQHAAELMLALTRGVDAIHERGVIHRDIKPANVVINRHGEPVLTDFGLARPVDNDESTSRQIGDLSGTPAYMAPEQIDGRVPVDQRSDVYSLGVLLYQLLTGSLPFTGSLEIVLEGVCHQPPPRPSSLRPGLDNALELICLKALEKKRDDRFESAEAMAQSLESCVTTLQRRRQKHRRRLIAAIGTTLTAIIAVMAAWLLREPPASDEEMMLLAQPRSVLRVPGSDSSHRAVVPAGGSRLIVASRYEGYAPFRFFNTESRKDEREFHFDIPDTFYSDSGQPRHDHMGGILSKDDRYLYCNDYYATCLLRIDLDSPDGRVHVDFLPISHRWSQVMSLSPDGTRLIAATGQSGRPGERHDNTLVIVDVEDGAFKKVTEVQLAEPQQLTNENAISEEIVGTRFGFRKNGESIFALTGKFSGTEPTLVKVSTKEPYSVSRHSLSASKLVDLVVANEHDRILLSDALSRSIRVMNLDDLTDTDLAYSMYGHVPGPLALNRDESVLFVLCPEARKLVCLDPATGEIIGGAHDLPDAGDRLHLSSDGSRVWTVHAESQVAEFEVDDLLHRIVFASNPDGTHQIHAMTLGGSNMKLSEGPHTERCPRWSPDGRRIAFISNRAGADHICLMNRAGDGVRVLKQTDPVIGEQHEVPLAWSPDGTQIAFVGKNHKAIRVVEIESGDVRTLLDGPAKLQADRVYDHHNGLSWSQTRNAVVFNSQVESFGHDQDLLSLNPETRTVTRITDLWGQPKYFVAPSTASDDGRISAVMIDPGPPTAWRICTLDGTAVRSIGEFQSEELRNPRWLPDGKRLLFSAGPPGSAKLLVIPAKGGDSKPMKSHGPDNIDADIWSVRRRMQSDIRIGIR